MSKSRISNIEWRYKMLCKQEPIKSDNDSDRKNLTPDIDIDLLNILYDSNNIGL